MADRKYVRYEDKHLYEKIPPGEAEDIEAVNEMQKAVWQKARHAYTGKSPETTSDLCMTCEMPLSSAHCCSGVQAPTAALKASSSNVDHQVQSALASAAVAVRRRTLLACCGALQHRDQ